MINELAATAHANQIAKGFVKQGEPRNFGECIALIHSEISEALEGHREGVKEPGFGEKFAIDKEIQNIQSTKEATPIYNQFKKCVGFEFADAMIRIMASAEEHGIEDLEWYILTKMAYNAKRPYKHEKAY